MADEPEAQGARATSEQAKALDKVTDQVEEREVKNVDQSKIQAAMAELAQQQRVKHEAARLREKTLSAVKIQASDVEVLVREFEVDKKAAELRLREHGGDVRAALASYLA
ncbi:hypothetical protein ACKKBF_B36120 [Auxenochlorella protothecoides x Auxenochlorella symbiontica]|uniref:Nascent polypeptide-associated complex subunit alpha-like UBA domain-containing protein n=2 Tax=Auxenochlorella protothecoides TaxID=3075 RepID=A0A3M7L380_AUXPR|nr:hypothetical protein APUTEX25_004688 [Auxenochlorella protothecoides]|eukprot:RMZ56465.1 hypothetical protein APUTEX25_004688 [Auxenochlorella protothecoides]